MTTNLPRKLYVAINGDDRNPGTKEKPFATLQHAKMKVREMNKNGFEAPIHILVRGGTYHLSEPLLFEPADSGSMDCPVIYRAFPRERVIISGGKRLLPKWEPYRDGIWYSQLSEEELGAAEFNQLFVNGKRQIRARFPNYAQQEPFNPESGYITAAWGTDKRPDKEIGFDPAAFTKKRWSNPSTGIVHAFQSHYWGNMQYKIADVDWDSHILILGEGGFQLQRSYGINQKSRFYVENVFEELDSPGEWFLDKAGGRLYYYPPEDLDLHHSCFVAAHLKQLVQFRGTASTPVSNIVLKGFIIAHTQATFLEKYEDLARGDWSIHRGGAVYLEGTADCAVKDCFFDAVGGNGVFMNRYNRSNIVSGCKFEGLGESAVCLVGASEAVPMYQTWSMMEAKQQPAADSHIGPKNEQYPESCVISNNIIRDIGVYGKQTAGVFISMSSKITVSHNTIYEVPRAAICINDGTWGGHVIEHNDIWETVRETGEHGPFNAWGRERQWDTAPRNMKKEAVFQDALEPVVIRHNRIANYRKSISAGNWTIDLDDGASNYHIYNNLCLGSTLKLRDGFYRKVENNIFVSPIPLGWHVWPNESEDTFERNIVVVSGIRPGQDQPTDMMYQPIGMPEHPWGKSTDCNLYWNVNTSAFLITEKPSGRKYDWEAWREMGYDSHSLLGDPLFVSPESGDYRVRDDSPALSLGFANFPMDQFGHKQTRIFPFGGSFLNETTVKVLADERGGDVWYTLDGSEPNPDNPSSFRYEDEIKLKKSAMIKTLTFKNGRAVGFSQTALFHIVEEIVYPSWLEKILLSDAEINGTVRSDTIPAPVAESLEWLGATLTDILDGDMVDALGGHNEGVLLMKVPEQSAARKLGLRASDVLIQWGENRIRTLRDFKVKCRTNRSESENLVLLRGYNTLTIAYRGER